jgi:hypothetical protein
MKTKLLTTAFILALLFTATTGTTLAQTAILGVSKGDTFNYDYNILWESTDPTATPPLEYVDLNNTRSIQIKVNQVSGNTITLEVTRHFRNGTESSETGQIDVNQEVIDVSFGFLIIRAGANPNEKIYPSGGRATITETVLRTYEKGERETNHYISESTEENTYDKVEIYFDKTTGVAVEYYNEFRETSNSYVTTTKETVTLDSSTLWTIPEFPTYAILLILTFTSLFIVLYVKKLQGASIDKGGTVLCYKLW